MEIFDVRRGVPMMLGHQGDGSATAFRFRKSFVDRDKPVGGVYQLIYRNPAGGTFPRVLTQDGDSVLWTVLQEDTQQEGPGEVELRYVWGETGAYNSEIWPAYIERSLVENGETPPEYQSWVDEVTRQAANAETAVQHYPYVDGDSGHWMVYDALLGVFTDTGVSATGPQGIQGIQGPRGYTGLRGADGAPGRDGADGAPGPQGPPGADGRDGRDGADGQQGPQGVPGPPGTPGADGRSFSVLGLYATLSALQAAHPTGNAGDAYAVGTSASNVIYIWDADAQQWANVGALQGPEGPQGQQGIQGPPGENGANGQDGDPGPNEVSTSTDSSITGLLKGEDGKLKAAVPGVDYARPGAAGVQIATGNYEGTDHFGEDHKNLIVFPFTPKLVYICGTDGDPESGGSAIGQAEHSALLNIKAMQQYQDLDTCSFCTLAQGQNRYEITVSEEGGLCTLRWWNEEDMTAQLNLGGYIYDWTAIG